MEPEVVQVIEARHTNVGELAVRRALPARGRRSVGPWCFVDHLGPALFSDERHYDVAPHPHIGLQTVTWLFDGALVHRDSMGSEQLIRAGELNLMVAGNGVAHSEENPGITRGELHGVQLWVAQRGVARVGPACFEHVEVLPTVSLGAGEATVLVGGLEEGSTPDDTELVGAELRLRPGRVTVALRHDFEYALIPVRGSISVNGVTIVPDHLVYLGTLRDEIELGATADAVVMLIGGVPLDEELVMWWNFVARSRGEIDAAYESWMKQDERFGRVESALARIEVGPPPWQRRRSP